MLNSHNLQLWRKAFDEAPKLFFVEEYVPEDRIWEVLHEFYDSKEAAQVYIDYLAVHKRRARLLESRLQNLELAKLHWS